MDRVSVQVGERVWSMMYPEYNQGVVTEVEPDSPNRLVRVCWDDTHLGYSVAESDDLRPVVGGPGADNRWKAGDRVESVKPPTAYYGPGDVVYVEQDKPGDPGLVQVRWDDPDLNDELMYPNSLRRKT